ncbi:MAG: [FeFe] hydrogenase, group A [bacterium]|nr:[FeFe] hydrogenase, group A [bacterium]
MAVQKIDIYIDGKRIPAYTGQTILEVAKNNGIYIPSLCHHEDVKVKANCRVCVVKIDGQKGLSTACSMKVFDGMKIATNSSEVKRARKINLELIFSQHNEECKDCVWEAGCDLLRLAEENNVKINRFNDRKINLPVYQFGNAIQFDASKCIDCRNCIDVCHSQGVDFLEIKEKDNFQQVVPSKKWNKDCVYCGQCLIHCPAGAFEAVGEFEGVSDVLKDKSKAVVFQFAPSIRSALGEEFGLEAGRITTGKIVSALRLLGAAKVFDTSVGADFTTVSEGLEVIERMKKNKRLPVLTSCCPSWVRYIELYYSEFIKNLSTTRSPQIILGGLVKTYWAKKENINPKDIFSVSIMPCISKKYEISRPQLKINGLRPVDYVLTTREFARLIKINKIDFKNLKSGKADNVFGDPSGAGVIYGASGGVMESAFRTVYEKLTGMTLKNIDFRQARGMEQVKEAKIKIGDDVKKIAIINGLGNAKKFLDDLKAGKRSGYSCIEVMACLGGCVGGGGQPMPTTPGIRLKRAEALYDIDKQKKVRKAHKNPIVKEVYRDFIEKHRHLGHKILHTSYSRKFKNRIKKI